MGSYVARNSFDLQKVVGSIVLPKLRSPSSSSKRAKNEKLCEIYSLESRKADDVLVVVCEYDVADDRCVAWTQALFERVSASVVCIIDDISLEACHRVQMSASADSSVIFATTNNNASTMFEQIITKQQQHGQALVTLASLSPLLLTGVGAALMQYCLFHKVFYYFWFEY